MMGSDQIFYRAMGRTEPRTQVIGARKLESATIANIEEDLTVMSHILEKATENSPNRSRSQALGITLMTGSGMSAPQNIYLEGFGILFQLSAPFPLVAPPNRNEEKKDKPQDSPWEQARREIYGPRDNLNQWFGGMPNPPIEFDAERVENLKNDLLESLKQAANIRNLKGDDAIVVAVTGTESGVWTTHVRRGGAGAARPGASEDGPQTQRGPGPQDRFNVAVAGVERGPAKPTTLTIRVKKSDVDSFAKGKITLDEFKSKAAINSY